MSRHSGITLECIPHIRPEAQLHGSIRCSDHIGSLSRGPAAARCPTKRRPAADLTRVHIFIIFIPRHGNKNSKLNCYQGFKAAAMPTEGKPTECLYRSSSPPSPRPSLVEGGELGEERGGGGGGGGGQAALESAGSDKQGASEPGAFIEEEGRWLWVLGVGYAHSHRVE